MVSGVYEIRNVKDGRTYIGSAVNTTKRRQHHLDELRVNKHRNLRLQNAFNKYGEDAFIWNVLEVVPDVTMLIEAEQRHMDAGNPFYNICRVAGSQLGMKHSEETKKKIRDIKTGLRVSEETRAKMSRSQTGRRHTAESRAKISAARAGNGNGMFGKRHSPEALAKILAANRSQERLETTRANFSKGWGWNKGLPFSEESRRRMSESQRKTPVERICPRTGEVKPYPSIKSVKVDGFLANRVCDCCRGAAKSHKGYMWRYASRQTHPMPT